MADSFAHARFRFGSVPLAGLHRSVQRVNAEGDCSSTQYVIVNEAVFADVVAAPPPAMPAIATATTATRASMAQGYPQGGS